MKIPMGAFLFFTQYENTQLFLLSIFGSQVTGLPEILVSYTISITILLYR